MGNSAKDRTATAAEELTKGREFTVQLGMLVQETWPEGSSAAVGLINKVINSFSQALHVLLDSDASGRNPISNEKCIGAKRKNTGAGRGGFRKRKQASQWRTVVSDSNGDEYSWRKYGQKEIHSSKFPRSYFRCTRKFDQGCQATKQVQKSEEDPSLFVITYMGEHTCTNNHNIILSSNSSEPSIISFGSNTSNVTHDVSPLFPKRPGNEEEVLSNHKPITSSSDIFDLPSLCDGSLPEPLMNESALQRGDESGSNFDMSFFADSFVNFEDDGSFFDDQDYLFRG